MILLLTVLAACQEPFGADRHDLVGFRVAALSVEVEGETVHPKAALVVDGRLWSDVAVDLEWAWLDPDQLPEVGGRVDGFGPAPLLEHPQGEARLGLVATSPEGEERRAVVDLIGAPLPRLGGIALERVEGLGLAGLTAEDLALSNRVDLPTTPVDHLAPGEVGRLRAEFERPPPAEALLRWMTTGGTFFELDPATADWVAGEIVLDDEVVVERQPLGDGPQSVVALAVSPGALPRFRLTEILVGTPPAGAWTTTGRWLPADGPLPAGWVEARLVSDDQAPAGLRLTDPISLESPPSRDPAEDLDCIDVHGPFDPGWLATGQCLRADLDGARVVVELR